MAEGEDEGGAGWRASVRNEVDARVGGSVVQAGSITGDVVIGTESGRAWSELDEWTEGLARAVQAVWQAEEANRQIHDPVPLPVRWHAARSTLTDHWTNIRRRPTGAEAEPLSLAGQLEQIAAVYERIPSRRLVVLGPAGSGKTVLAGRLALDLLAARRPGQPVPVIVSIGAWNPATTSLRTWLTEQLIRDHPGLAADAGSGDSSSRAAALVAAERILPILDGFDEIESGLHEAAVHQLNTTAEIPLVITSREEEYAAAVHGADVVTAAAVVVLEELTWQDLAAYLPRTAAGYRTGMWDAVLERMRAQPHAPDAARLRRVLTNPLMVFLARTVYSDAPGQEPAQLLDPAQFPTEQALQQHLLAAFVPAVYRPDRPGPARSTDRARRHWSAEQARRYLTHLANHLHRAGTRDLAWWQLRDTIPRPRRTLILAATDALSAMLAIGVMDWLEGGLKAGITDGLMIGIVTILASGLTVAVTVGLSTGFTSPRLRKLPRFLTGKAALALGTGLTVGFAVWLALWLGSGLVGLGRGVGVGIVFGLWFGIVGGAAAGLVGLRSAGPQPSRTRLQIRGRIRVLVGRFAVGFAAGLAVAFAALVAGAVWLGVPTGIAEVFTTTLVLELLSKGIVVGFAAVLVYGFEAPLNADEVVSAAESLARDRRNSILKIVAATLVAGLLIGNVASTPYTIAYGIVVGIAVGWMSARATNAWLFWIVLVRGWLPLTGHLPWRVQAFLADAHQRGVLRQTGPVYQFRHATLQDHLTTEVPTPTAAANP